MTDGLRRTQAITSTLEASGVVAVERCDGIAIPLGAVTFAAANAALGCVLLSGI